MIQYLIKRKVQKEVEEKGKKVLIYTGAIATGVGVYFSYKMIKKLKQKREIEDENYYLTDSEYDLYDYEDELQQEDEEKDELQQKVDEFNARRINCENCPHVSQEDMKSYVKSIEDTKEDVEISENDYKEEPYEKYEYLEENLEDK